MAFRILIADDYPAVRTALRQLLSGKNREIVEAADGADAVAKALQNPPDVAVLDLVMPALDGLAAARELLTQLPNVAVVMCTMHCSPQLEVEALKFGVNKVISKAHGGLLVSTVEQILASRQNTEAEAQPAPLILPPGISGNGALPASISSDQNDLPAAPDLLTEPSPTETTE